MGLHHRLPTPLTPETRRVMGMSRWASGDWPRAWAQLPSAPANVAVQEYRLRVARSSDFSRQGESWGFV